ncbi:MAG: MarR family transcriptional regulator [Mycobacterium sp.]|jgi:DNA-binding MarR family transcriptional regulator|nr:MarR family transcriptional regulator [Mycobacterium sp.]
MDRQGSARRYGVPASPAAWDSVDHLLAEWARERPDLDFTPVGIVNRLGRVRTQLERHLAEVFADHDLTPPDFHVVVTLRRSGPPYRMPQARLMEALGLTSGTVSLRLDRLVKFGVVAREPDPADRRGALVRLTEDGQRLFDLIAPQHLANEDELLSALGEDERRTLADLLRRLLASFETRRCPLGGDLGLTLESAIVARRRRRAVGLSDTPGLLVAAVEAGTAADVAGLRRGDLIVAMDNRPALSEVVFAERVEELSEAEGLNLTVLRGNAQRDVEIRRPKSHG